MSLTSTSFIVPEFVETAIASAPLRLPVGYIPTGVRDVATKGYVDSAGSTPQTNIIYLSSAGSANPDGLTLDTAYSTLPAAINAAAAIITQRLAETPPNLTAVVVYCADSAVLTLTENLTIPSGVFLHAPLSIIVGDGDAVTITVGYLYSGITILGSFNVYYTFEGKTIAPSPPLPWESIAQVYAYLNAKTVRRFKLITLNTHTRITVLCNIDTINIGDVESDSETFNIQSTRTSIYVRSATLNGAVYLNGDQNYFSLVANSIMGFSTTNIVDGSLIVSSLRPLDMGSVTVAEPGRCEIHAPVSSTPTELGTAIFDYKYPYSMYYDVTLINMADGITEVPVRVHFTRVGTQVTARLVGCIFTASNTYLEGNIPDPAFYVDAHAYTTFTLTGGAGTVGVAKITMDRELNKFTIKNNVGDSFPVGELMLNSTNLAGDLTVAEI